VWEKNQENKHKIFYIRTENCSDWLYRKLTGKATAFPSNPFHTRRGKAIKGIRENGNETSSVVQKSKGKRVAGGGVKEG